MRFLVKRRGDVLEVLQKHAYKRHLYERIAEKDCELPPIIKYDSVANNAAADADITGFFIRPTSNAIDLPLPARQSPLAAGMDLHANVTDPVCIKKGARVLIPTGIKIALPIGYEAQVRPRSGLAFHFGVTVLNAPGTVDADYRGEIGVLLINLGDKDFIVRRGDRIAQLVVARVEMMDFTVVNTLPDSLRGDGGYGSTGVMRSCSEQSN